MRFKTRASRLPARKRAGEPDTGHAGYALVHDMASDWQSASALRQCRKEIAIDGPVVRAASGQPKPHPAGAMLKAAQENIARLAHDFGISPAARNRKSMSTPPEEGEPDGWSDLDI